MTQATLSGGSMAEIPDPGPRPLWTGEVAQLAGVTRMTINRWANAGRLPHVRTLGGNRRYEQADVKKLLVTMGRPVPDWLRGGSDQVRYANGPDPE
jgi:excisionase family DNA binding protein